MNKVHIFGALGLVATISACATSAVEPPVAEAGQCNAAAAQGLNGEVASQEIGAEAVRLSGARELRWIPLDSAVTMGFRPMRLNIELDGNNVVRTIRCG